MGRVKGNVDLKRRCRKARNSQRVYARHQRRQEIMPDRANENEGVLYKNEKREGNGCM